MEQLTQSRSSAIQKKCSQTVELKVLGAAGNKFGSLVVAKDENAHESTELLASLNMMLAHSSGDEATPKPQMMMMREAMKRNAVTCEEAIEAFWKAYADPYVSQGRIEFRHMWKHIEKMRKGEDGKTYTYEQMLTKMQKESLPMECFDMIDEEDSRGRKKWVVK